MPTGDWRDNRKREEWQSSEAKYIYNQFAYCPYCCRGAGSSWEDARPRLLSNRQSIILRAHIVDIHKTEMFADMVAGHDAIEQELKGESIHPADFF